MSAPQVVRCEVYLCTKPAQFPYFECSQHHQEEHERWQDLCSRCGQMPQSQFGLCAGCVYR